VPADQVLSTGAGPFRLSIAAHLRAAGAGPSARAELRPSWWRRLARGLAGRVPDTGLGFPARALVGADPPDLVDKLPLVPVQPQLTAAGGVVSLRRHLAVSRMSVSRSLTDITDHSRCWFSVSADAGWSAGRKIPVCRSLWSTRWYKSRGEHMPRPRCQIVRGNLRTAVSRAYAIRSNGGCCVCAGGPGRGDRDAGE
jgi:hypothetical protein